MIIFHDDGTVTVSVAELQRLWLRGDAWRGWLKRDLVIQGVCARYLVRAVRVPCGQRPHVERGEVWA